MAELADQFPEFLAIGWLWALTGCAIAVRLGHRSFARLALSALIWPAIAWLALLEWIDRTNLPGERT